jgi:hypothetical protein
MKDCFGVMIAACLLAALSIGAIYLRYGQPAPETLLTTLIRP